MPSVLPGDRGVVARLSGGVPAQSPGMTGGMAERDELKRLFELMLLIRVFEPEAERQYKKARIGGYCHLATGQEADARRRRRRDARGRRARRGLSRPRAGARARARARRGDGRAVRPRRRLRARSRRLDAPARRRPRLPRRLGHRRRASAGRHRRRARARAARRAARGPVRARRRRGQHRRLARVAQPRRRCGICRSSSCVVNNLYGMGTHVDRASAEPELYKRAAAYRMHGERVDGDDLVAVLEVTRGLLGARPRRAPPGRARGDHLPLPRALGGRRGLELPQQGRGQRASAPRPDRARRRAASDSSEERGQGAARAGQAARQRSRRSSPRTAPEPDVESLGEHVYGDPDSAEQVERMAVGAPFGESTLIRAGGPQA